MPPLKIGLIDLVSKGPASTLWAKIMHANLASIMPQVIATWCEQEGHEVTMICYTGYEDLTKELPKEVDLVFISTFTQAALLGYALSNYYRSKGAVTVLGGPHARCYPDDAALYFDYVLGFTSRAIITDILNNCVPQRPVGIQLSAGKQPAVFCGVQERWKFIEPTLKKAPFLQIVPMLGSVGCPYTCSFCIDSTVPYQPLDFQVIRSDLQFLRTKYKKPWIAFHDPNFGVRFEENMEAIASAGPPKSFHFIAESSLSILTVKHLDLLQQNGFIALLPGIESWYDLGNKSKASHITGMEKVNQVSEHVNKIFQYVPYVQTNFVLGLDSDAGTEPFELTKRFIDQSPNAFPGFSLLTAFGEAAPMNLEYQKQGRVLPFPFHFLNNHLAMNIKPKNYDWVDFYDKVIDVTDYAFSAKALYRRFIHTHGMTTRWMNLMRAISSEGWGRLKFYRQIRQQLINDKNFRQYFDGETKQLPAFYYNIIKKDLGIWWQWLPETALSHNANAYLDKSMAE
ncbi:radical SAM protein [Niastella koreensis]|uniref:Radical SAM domain protein n=2 Tax=Niastella koreensis TaxID=354356 RepID=G8T982_NIAKG|nr:radical SAM protein [Niastella koreensis]AEV98050.1 Radical SAM domain protein [Niastella koreensis GR20-10]OQP40152.1 radical SAM protein [Niastella koreensis]